MNRPGGRQPDARSLRCSACVTCSLAVAEAGDQVIVHHARRLHEGVAYRRPDETEAGLLQCLAHVLRRPASWPALGPVGPAVDGWVPSTNDHR